MGTYIALLRGINVSGQKKIKMAELGQMMRQLGFQEVVTYIQSGNLIFNSGRSKVRDLEETIKAGIESTFGFDVPVLVKTRTDLTAIVAENPFNESKLLEANGVYYVLLKEEPEPGLITSLQQETYVNEQFHIAKGCVYLACLKGYGNAKLSNNLMERKLKVPATTRNHRTMLKLLELSKRH